MFGSARIRPLPVRCLAALVWLCACGKDARAQQPPVDVKVEFVRATAAKKQVSTGSADVSNVAVWLTPLDPSAERAASTTAAKFVPKLVQRNKVFEPHMLVIHVGTVVQFPNKDPFFHNVFSLFDGKRFDLGLYEAGTSKSLRFDHPGISFLFCNIHSEMSAVVIALETPYYGVSNRSGKITIAEVPSGKYILHVWREGSSPEALKALARQIVVSSDSSSFGKLAVPDNAALPVAHKNKYGNDHENTTPGGTTYNPRQ